MGDPARLARPRRWCACLAATCMFGLAWNNLTYCTRAPSQFSLPWLSLAVCCSFDPSKSRILQLFDFAQLSAQLLYMRTAKALVLTCPSDCKPYLMTCCYPSVTSLQFWAGPGNCRSVLRQSAGMHAPALQTGRQLQRSWPLSEFTSCAKKAELSRRSTKTILVRS